MHRGCVALVLALLLAVDGALGVHAAVQEHATTHAGALGTSEAMPEALQGGGDDEAMRAHQLRFVLERDAIVDRPLSEHVAKIKADALVPEKLPFVLDWGLSEAYGVEDTKRAWALFRATGGIAEQRRAFPTLFTHMGERPTKKAAAAAQERVELVLEMAAARAELAMRTLVAREDTHASKRGAHSVASSVALRRATPDLAELDGGLDAAFAAFGEEYHVIVDKYGGFSADGMRAYIRDETTAQWERAKRMASVYRVGARDLNGVINDMVENLKGLGRGTLGLAYLKGLGGSIEFLEEQRADLNDAQHGPLIRAHRWFADVDTLLADVRAGKSLEAARAARLERELRAWVTRYQDISDVVYTFNSAFIHELDRSAMKATLVREVAVAVGITIVTGGLGSAAGAATTARVAQLAVRTQQIVNVAVRSAVAAQRGVQLALRVAPAVMRAATLLQRGLPILARFSTAMLSGGATKWLFTRIFAMEALLIQGNFAPEAWSKALADKGLHEFLQGVLDGFFGGLGGKAVFGYALGKAGAAGKWMVTRLLSQAAKVRFLMPASSRAMLANAAGATRAWMARVATSSALSADGAARLARIREALGKTRVASLVASGTRAARSTLSRMAARVGEGTANMKDLSVTAICNIFLGGVDNLVHHMVGMLTDPAWRNKSMEQRVAHLRDQLTRATVGGLVIESVMLAAQPFMPLLRRGSVSDLLAQGKGADMMRRSLQQSRFSPELRRQLDEVFVSALSGAGKNTAAATVVPTKALPATYTPLVGSVYLERHMLRAAGGVPVWTETNEVLDVAVWRSVHGLAAQLTVLAFLKRPHDTPSFADVQHMERVAMDVLGLAYVPVHDDAARIVYAFVLDYVEEARSTVFAEQMPILREVLRDGVAKHADDKAARNRAWRLVRDALHVIAEAGPAARELVDDLAPLLVASERFPDGCEEKSCTLAMDALGAIRTPAAGELAARFLRDELARTTTASAAREGTLAAAVRAIRHVASVEEAEEETDAGATLTDAQRRTLADVLATMLDTDAPYAFALRNEHARVLGTLLELGDASVVHVLPRVLAFASSKTAYFRQRSRRYRDEVGALLRRIGAVARSNGDETTARVVAAYAAHVKHTDVSHHLWGSGQLVAGLGAAALAAPEVRDDLAKHLAVQGLGTPSEYAVDVLLRIGTPDAYTMLAHALVVPKTHVARALFRVRDAEHVRDVIATFFVPLLVELVMGGDTESAAAAAKTYLTLPAPEKSDAQHPNRVTAAKSLGWLVESEVIAALWAKLPALPTVETLDAGATDGVDGATDDAFHRHLLLIDTMFACTNRLINHGARYTSEGRAEVNEQLSLFVGPLSRVLQLVRAKAFRNDEVSPPMGVLTLVRRALFVLGHIGKPAMRTAPTVLYILQTVESPFLTVRSLVGRSADVIVKWVYNADSNVQLLEHEAERAKRSAAWNKDDAAQAEKATEAEARVKEAQANVRAEAAVLLQALANAVERVGVAHEWVAVDTCSALLWLPLEHSEPMEASVHKLLAAHPKSDLVTRRCNDMLARWKKERAKV